MPVILNSDGGRRAEWTFSAQPELEIGGDDADALFMVTSAVRTGDEIVVANAGTGELRWFDASGRAVRSAGRKGSGPGEFQHIGWIGMLPGDSVGAWDPVLRRLSVFDPAGRFGRSLPIPAPGPLASVAGVLENRFLVVAARTRSEPPAGAATWRDSLVLLRVALADGTVDTLGRFPGTEWYADAGASRVQTRPMGRQTVAAAAGGRFYVGTGDYYDVGAYGPDGTLRSRIRKPHQPLRVRAEDRAAFLAGVVRVGGTAQDRQERARAMENAPFPETMPPYISLITDAAGNLWVREMQRPGATPEISRWSVFDAGGEWIASVRGPARFKAFQIGPDWILGTQTDSAGVEYVRIYRIVKS